MREAANLIANRCRKDNKAVCLSWVKSQIGIEGNEVADKLVNRCYELCRCIRIPSPRSLLAHVPVHLRDPARRDPSRLRFASI